MRGGIVYVSALCLNSQNWCHRGNVVACMSIALYKDKWNWDPKMLHLSENASPYNRCVHLCVHEKSSSASLSLSSILPIIVSSQGFSALKLAYMLTFCCS